MWSKPFMSSPSQRRCSNPFSASVYCLQRFLRQGYYLTPWKDGYLTPNHRKKTKKKKKKKKKNDKSLPSNFRPISLLDHVCKTMERCAHKHLVYVFEKIRYSRPGLFMGTQLLSSYNILTIRFLKVTILKKRFVPSFAIHANRRLFRTCSEMVLQLLSSRRQYVVLRMSFQT